MAVLLDTARLDVDARAEALHLALTSRTAPHDLLLMGRPENVHAKLEYWALGDDVSVLKQTSSGISHTRSEKHDRTDGPERVVFVLHDGAVGSYIHEGVAHRLSRGSLYVTDLNSHYSYTRPGDGVARIVQIERSALELSVEQVQEASGRILSSPLYNLFRSNVAVLCRDAGSIEATPGAPKVGSAMVSLASALLCESDETDLVAISSDWLVDRIQLYLGENYWRHDLTADQIASDHGISVRYLFKLWATQPQSLGETMMLMRLNAAHRMLAFDPSLPVSAVAYRCGFENVSHFDRRFRKAFGDSPTAIRREERPELRL